MSHGAQFNSGAAAFVWKLFKCSRVSNLLPTSGISFVKSAAPPSLPGPPTLHLALRLINYQAYNNSVFPSIHDLDEVAGKTWSYAKLKYADTK